MTGDHGPQALAGPPGPDPRGLVPGVAQVAHEAPADVDAVFAALADGTRREVVAILADGDTVTATGIAARLPVSRQAVAKHLQVLAEARLVGSARVGRETRYQLTPEPLGEAMAWMLRVGAEWDVRLAELGRLLPPPEPPQAE